MPEPADPPAGAAVTEPPEPPAGAAVTEPAALVAELAPLVAELAPLIAEAAGESPDWAAAITAGTRLHDDLELESLELAALGAALRGRYGPAVRLDRYLAGLDLDQLIELTVGDLAGYLARCRDGGAPHGGGR